MTFGGLVLGGGLTVLGGGLTVLGGGLTVVLTGLGVGGLTVASNSSLDMGQHTLGSSPSKPQKKRRSLFLLTPKRALHEVSRIQRPCLLSGVRQSELNNRLLSLSSKITEIKGNQF